MSLIADWKKVVLKVFQKHILTWGHDHKNTKTSYHLWCKAMQQNEPHEIIDCLSEVFLELNAYVNTKIHQSTSVNSPSLGKLRQMTEFKQKRIAANLKGRNREVTLERSIVRAMRLVEGESWYNQFNVAGGMAGSTSDKKTSIDLVRHSRLKGEYTFIELKDWKAADSPLRILFEIVLYGILFTHAKQFSRVNGLHNDTEKIKNVRLAAMVPDQWLEQFRSTTKYPIAPDRVFELAHQSLLKAQSVNAELMQGIVIEPRIYYLRGISRTAFGSIAQDDAVICKWVTDALS